MQTKDDAYNYATSYIRNLITNNLYSDSPFNNAITVEGFGDDFFVTAYDLTEGCTASNYFLSPKLRNSNLRVNVNFSKPIRNPVTMIYFAEYPTTLYVSHNGNKFSIAKSYLRAGSISFFLNKIFKGFKSPSSTHLKRSGAFVE